MISDTQAFMAAMAARGELRFAPVKVRRSRAERDRAYAERKRRAVGRRVYAQPFKGQLPARSDPGYRTIYMRLVRAAKKAKQL